MISIDDLTIGQARALVAQLAPLIGGTPATAPVSILAPYVGQMVVVRDHMAGVRWGRVARVGATSLVLEPGSRQGWRWQAEGACDGLASAGPVATSATRYGPPAPGEVYLCALVSIHPTTPGADAAWASMPVWG